MHILLSNVIESFPPVEAADANGFLCYGGDLSEQRLIYAYSLGIFPWYNPGDPILWWTPDPRLVIFPEQLKVQKSMRPYFNQRKFDLTYDRAFEAVLRACANVSREGQRGTWISEDIIQAYKKLYERGLAHSVEVWQNDKLVGGLYGVSLGGAFFGESMFALVSNASKFGFISLVRALQKKGFLLIDCQIHTPHLASLGAIDIPRDEFMQWLDKTNAMPTLQGNWNEMLMDEKED